MTTAATQPGNQTAWSAGIPNTTKKAAEKLGRMPTIFSKKDGSIVGVNKQRLYETPFLLQTNPPNNIVVAPAGATSPQTSLRVSAEGPMQIREIAAQRSNPVSVQIYMQDGTSPRKLMNAPCHIDTIFGTGGQEYPLPEALYIDENSSMTIAFTDLSGAGSNVQVAMQCAKYGKLQSDPTLTRIKQRLKSRQYLSMPFFQTFDQGSVALTALQNTQIEMLIGADYHFLISQISFVSTGTFSLNIIDETKGESIINAPSNTNYAIPSLLLCGTNQYPYRFTQPILVQSQQRLLFTLQDTSGAANTIWITLGGQFLSTRMWS